MNRETPGFPDRKLSISRKIANSAQVQLPKCKFPQPAVERISQKKFLYLVINVYRKMFAQVFPVFGSLNISKNSKKFFRRLASVLLMRSTLGFKSKNINANVVFMQNHVVLGRKIATLERLKNFQLFRKFQLSAFSQALEFSAFCVFLS